VPSHRSIAAAVIALVLVVGAAVVVLDHSHSPRPMSSPSHPNIVFLLTDDLDVSEMAYMPHVRQLLRDEGVTFDRYYVSVSLCCPSRSSILRGQYSHNTGVETNGSANGGFETAHRLGIERSTIGTWMHDAGYRTAYIGKYLNAYPASVADTYVPPGWDEFASASRGDPYTEYDYTLNENGHLVHHGHAKADYGTDVYIAKAKQFIESAAGRSFFAYVNVYAPHQPAVPAPSDGQLFNHKRAPRTPSFNQVDASKPGWLRSQPPLDAASIRSVDHLYRDRIRSLQAVDRGVATLIDTLQSTHQLANTYFVFSSDNGFHLGQFRMPAGKETAYESDIHVPLVVRGPGVPTGHRCEFLVGNVDLAPTFAALAHVSVPAFVDGRNVASLFTNPASDPQPRRAYLVEHWKETLTPNAGPAPTEPHDLDGGASGSANGVAPPRPNVIPEFHGVRTEHFLYVEYVDGSRELYATDHDPYEIHNIVSDRSEQALVARLHARVAALEICRAADCRRVESEPVGS
jgi:arylsulfatase A-like enzyme